MNMYEIRTDLALENTEKFKEDNIEISGVEIREEYVEKLELTITTVDIVNQQGEKAMGKSKGTYITLESPYLPWDDRMLHEEIAKILSMRLKNLLEKKSVSSILVVGLGNREITPDALGPQVVEHLMINRHLKTKLHMDIKEKCVISGLAPGVMAQTGMETTEIVSGVVKETRPDCIIAVDALAARSIHRLNRTIQITDTGINPGAGVCNHRNGLNKETVGIEVIAVGVPTVVDAAAIVYDVINGIIKEQETETVMQEMLTQEWNQMFVTPKDIDESIQLLSLTIAEAINNAVE